MEENKNLEQNLDNSNEKLHISDVINMLLTDEKIRNESWLEGADNNEGRAGFIHGANFVLNIIKSNCL
jgi:hypothetical protein